MNLQKLILLVSLLLSSCAHGDWKNEGVAPEKRKWRFCSAIDLDMQDKGICYWDLECKRIMLIKTCRRIQLFCAWGDLECMESYGIINMIIQTRENL